MITRRFEIYILEPLSDLERVVFETALDISDYDHAIPKSGHLIMLEGPENIYEVIQWVADSGLGDHLGNIREVVDYEPMGITAMSDFSKKVGDNS